MDIFKENCKWSVANGRCGHILKDLWISELSLMVDTIMFDISTIISETKVSKFIMFRRDSAMFATVFNPLFVETISVILISCRSSEGLVLWHGMALRHLCNLLWIWKSVVVLCVWAWVWKIVIG